MERTSLETLLVTVEAEGAQEADGLQVFGLRWGCERGPDYATLDESLAAGSFEVSEVSAQGSVPTLKVTNTSDRPVFLLSGEQMIGAKQNRVLNTSLMIPAKSEMPVPVSCVEAGRWNDRARGGKFSSEQTMSHGTLRQKITGHSSKSYRERGTPTSDQGEVWGEVSRKLAAMGSHSPSSAMAQAYYDHGQRLEAMLQQLRSPQGCHGVAFAFKGKVAGADLFDRPETLEKLWAKLVRGFALDALEPRRGDEPEPAPVTTAEVVRWLRAAAAAKPDPFPSPGMGIDVRLAGEGLVGASLLVEDRPIHLELFPAETTAGS